MGSGVVTESWGDKAVHCKRCKQTLVPTMHSDIDGGNKYPFKLTCTGCGKVLDRDPEFRNFLIFVVAIVVVPIIVIEAGAALGFWPRP